MEQSDWKLTKLSLERPYKDDHGECIPNLLDITPSGQLVFDSPGNPSELLGENLRRIFVERGIDFFDRWDQSSSGAVPQPLDTSEFPGEDGGIGEEYMRTSLTAEELFNMRTECIPQLFVALGEMTQARDLLSLLLSSTSSQPSTHAPSLPPSTLTATVVAKPPVVLSVEAFNAQLTIGGKDDALRKASDVFKEAETKLERSRQNSSHYWADALRIRRANWSLIPAPLPFGAPTGKGADKTSKDFLIAFGLEESPIQFRRLAVAHMATCESDSGVLQFPHRRRHRLRVSLIAVDSSGVICRGNNIASFANPTSLDGSLRAAQKEVLEEEVFSVLIKEASDLPTASARVSERLIIIDAAQGMELRFEMVDDGESFDSAGSYHAEVLAETCDLIYYTLHALLLSMHAIQKSQRIQSAGSMRSQPAVIPLSKSVLLQPVIDLLQYQQFCSRIKSELDKMVIALRDAGVPCMLRFDPVGETGQQLQCRTISGDASFKVGGEALLRVDDRQTLRLTFSSPSSLIAHLPQATLPIASVPQLCQLLSDEAEKCLLSKLCEAGSQRCDRVSSTWFVDTVGGKTVGRWEGCILHFCIVFGQDFAVHSSAYRLDRSNETKRSLFDTYSPQKNVSLVVWQQDLLQKILSKHL